MKVLMCCSNYWDSPIQVGDHHIARQFVAAGWEVGFLSAPISPFHLGQLGTHDFDHRLAIYRDDGAIEGKVWNYVPGAAAVPFQRFPFSASWLMRNWTQLTWPHLNNVLRKSGFADVDVIYFRDPRYTPILDEVNYRKSVYRIADHDAGFAFHTPAFREAEEKLARTVDLVAYTAMSLQEYVAGLQPQRMKYLPNGVEFGRFAEAEGAMPAEYANIPSPRALYVGSIDEWFDFGLLQSAAGALPDISFVLIGPDALARKRLAPLPNIHILGRKPKEAVPGYMHHADVGLIPFNSRTHKALVDSINPIKLFEYFACGLPVVSVEWREIKLLQLPTLLANSTESFVAQIRRALKQGKSADLKELAKENDASVRFRELVAELGIA